MLRCYWALALLALALGLAACSQREVDSISERESMAMEHDAGAYPVDRLAVIDNFGDLLLVKADGSDRQRITGDVRAGLLSQAMERNESYAWPTWSRNGSRIAFSRVSVGDSSANLAVQVLDVEGSQSATAYVNEIAAPVADGTPHYIYWAPDGQKLSFLAPTRDGLALFVVDGRGGEQPGVVAVGAPLYYQWSPGSTAVAVHSREQLAVLEIGSGREFTVDADVGAFRAPAISPDGETLAYVGGAGRSQGVFLTSTGAGGPTPRRIVDANGLTALAWSPDGSVVAVVDQRGTGAPVFDRLRLVAADTADDTTIVNEQLMAFFWAPDGRSIAWIGIDPPTQSMVLNVSSLEANEPAGLARNLFSFSPTGEFFTLLSFFDQYAYSHSIWAPDSSAVVVSATGGLGSDRRNGSGPHGGQIFVVDVASGEARSIASGKLAVWSWN